MKEFKVVPRGSSLVIVNINDPKESYETASGEFFEGEEVSEDQIDLREIKDKNKTKLIAFYNIKF